MDAVSNAAYDELTIAKEEYNCPITLECMQYPVIAEDMHSYERDLIIDHFMNKQTSPLTNLEIGTKLIDNIQLSNSIHEDLEKEKIKIRKIWRMC